MRDGTSSVLGSAVTACLWIAASAIGASAAVVTLEASEAAMIENPEEPTERRVLMRFDIPDHLSDGIVEIAALEFQTALSVPDSSEGVTLDCFQVTEPWDAESVDWDEGWDNAGGDFDTASHAMCGAAVGDSSHVQFDVTGMVASWATMGADNRGILVARAPGEEAVLQVVRGAVGQVVSSPRLTIWYTPRRSEQ
ncbi:MAG: DNRLRE domain-containing protein [Candidatus Eisenbacteria bacterium]|nr:DNRLRE domain-containing protein [Candidatus Eisenbacteria bacterium]